MVTSAKVSFSLYPDEAKATAICLCQIRDLVKRARITDERFFQADALSGLDQVWAAIVQAFPEFEEER